MPNGSTQPQPQQQQQQQPQQEAANGPINSRWVERAVLSDAKGTVRAVEFAPHHFGLKLVRLSIFLNFLSSHNTSLGFRQQYPPTMY